MDIVQFGKRKKSMSVSDNTLQAENQGSFLKNLRRFSAEVGKNIAIRVLKNPVRALEVTSNISTVAATKNHTAALSSLPEVINFYHTGKKFYKGKIV